MPVLQCVNLSQCNYYMLIVFVAQNGLVLEAQCLLQGSSLLKVVTRTVTSVATSESAHARTTHGCACLRMRSVLSDAISSVSAANPSADAKIVVNAPASERLP